MARTRPVTLRRWGVELCRGTDRFIALTDTGEQVLTFNTRQEARDEAAVRRTGPTVTAARAIRVSVQVHR